MTGSHRDLIYWPPPRGRDTTPGDLPVDIGGKAGGLLAIEAAGLKTAPWFVIRSTARPPDCDPDRELVVAIREACRELERAGARSFAVRSSGLDEDASERSFAGQYDTVLNVPAGEVVKAVRRCWRSADTPHVRAYRASMGVSADSPGMAVIVQAMVPATVSGIAFTLAPDGGEDAVVTATRGLGSDLARGAESGEQYRVIRNGRVREHDRNGISGAPLLSPAEVRRVVAAALRLEVTLGAPQDVEWSLTDRGTLLLLQTRPITAPRNGGRASVADDPGLVRLWDNANIVESFPGVTLPLTFSVAREAYAIVYRGACRTLGVTEVVIAANDDAFDQLLGHIRGRAYYDVGNWHRILALLPAFQANQAYLERMMGAARPGGGEGEQAPPVRPGRLGRAAALVILARAIVALVRFEARAKRFMAAEERLLDRESQTEVRDLPADTLFDRFESVRGEALDSWQAPILNDIFVMVFHGALRSAIERWCAPEAGQAVNRLLRAGRHPANGAADFLRAIAERVRAEATWLSAIDDPDPQAAAARLASDPALLGLHSLLADYLRGWGGRAPGALHLDRPSLTDDPGLLITTIRDLAVASDPPDRPYELRDRDAELDLAGAVRGRPLMRLLRRALLGFLIRRSRYHLTWRERMRLVRMDVFGAGRRIFTELDRAWVSRGILEATGDLHFLDVAEIRTALRGPGSMDGLGDLAASRRRAFDRYRVEEPPPNRFESTGVAIEPGPVGSPLLESGSRLQGTGVSAGRARGRSVVVVEPRATPTVAGRIVVARSTDPGWLPLMLSARGLLVEQGSLLSHSAIVARELGLPAVVGIPALTSMLAQEPDVELDGSTGVVEILPDRSGR